MDPAVLEAIGGWLRVLGTVGGILAVTAFVVLVVVGVVLFFVRGTHGVQAAPTEAEWFDALPEDHTPNYR